MAQARANDWSAGELDCAGRSYRIQRLAAVEAEGLGSLARLPRSIRVLLENLLRHEDGQSVTREDIAALAGWRADGGNSREIAFRPARVLLQDFTGVPAVVDLAAMREATADAAEVDAARINPQVSGRSRDRSLGAGRSVRWPGLRSRRNVARSSTSATVSATSSCAGAPSPPSRTSASCRPSTGHRAPDQPRVPRLGRVLDAAGRRTEMLAYPDTLVGTDSAHDHGERPWRAGVGGRRHRGRSRPCSGSRSRC